MITMQWKVIFRSVSKSHTGKSLEHHLSAIFDAEEIVKAKQERMPKHLIINIKNEFNFNGPVGQVIEHADNIGIL